jgi:hypothetical protein
MPSIHARRARRVGGLLFVVVAVVAIVGVRQKVLTDRAAENGNSHASSGTRAGDRPTVTPQQSLAALLDNKMPVRLLRLVAYDPVTEAQLSISHLKSLGRPGQKFTFVGDYDELRGATVVDTISRLGGSIKPGQHVSAIIFSAGERPLYPANARGLLQVIQVVEQSLAAGDGANNILRADLAKRLSPEALAALDNHDVAAGHWANYRPFYHAYEQAVAQLREDDPMALKYIGNIDHDWHPLGYAQAIGRLSGKVPDLSVELDGKMLPVLHFGARVFLVANAELADLKGQCLIDFDDPTKQRIPELDMIAAEGSP